MYHNKKSISLFLGVTKLLQVLGVDQWLAAFHQDMQLYRGEVNEMVNNLLQFEKPENQGLIQNSSTAQNNVNLVRNLRLASAFYYLRQLPVSNSSFPLIFLFF